MIVEFLIMMIKSPSSPSYNWSFGIGQSDNNGCCISCGYSWCETLQECVRVWETYCESLETGH